MRYMKVVMCALLMCTLSSCRIDSNKNGVELLPHDVKEQESSLDDIEVRQSSDYQYILGSGTTTPENNNTTVEVGSTLTGSSAGRLIIPGGVSLPYGEGERSVCITQLYQAEQHWGIDTNLIGSSRKMHAPIVSVTDGHVKYVGVNSSSAGNWVIVESVTLSNQKFYVIYMHLKDEPLVKVGEKVRRGQKIGYEGNSGTVVGKNANGVGGEHLHMEVCFSENGNPQGIAGRTQRLNPLAALYGYNIDKSTDSAVKKNLREESKDNFYVNKP